MLPCSDARDMAHLQRELRASSSCSTHSKCADTDHENGANRHSFSVVEDLVSQISQLLQTPDAESENVCTSRQDMTFAEELAILPPFRKEAAQLPTLVRGKQEQMGKNSMRKWICREDRISHDHLVHIKGPQPFREAEFDPTKAGPVGIGAHFEAIGRNIFVVSLVKNGPASRSRIAVGDKLCAVDYKPVRGKPMHELAKMILGVEGTKIRLVLQHQGVEYQVELLRLRPRAPLKDTSSNLRVVDEASLPAFLPL